MNDIFLRILEEIGEDKHDNLSTTSFKFKEDIWNFFENHKDKNCVEFGTHKGQTTKILSKLFKKVYTINLPDRFEAAKKFNSDVTNIEYIGMNLYGTHVSDNFSHGDISVIFIDADHSYLSIMNDFDRALHFNLNDDVFFIFDDYGMERGVKNAVDRLISDGRLSLVKYIGHECGHGFGGNPPRVLFDYEGIICKLNKNK